MNYKLSIGKARFEAITIQEIEKLEEKIGYKLPQDYKDFLLLYNGCWTGGEIYKYTRINHWDGDLEEIEFWINNFVPLSSNFNVGLFDDEENERPDRKYLKVAKGPGGGVGIYLSLNEETYGNIYYNEAAHEDYYYKIADNFTDFLKGFIYEPKDPYLYDEDGNFIDE